MRNPNASPQETAAPLTAADQPGVHAEFIAGSIPAWLVDALPERREAIKQAPFRLADWYLTAFCGAAPVYKQKL
ncbi:hypothetical protein [Pseudomonas sp. S2_F03]